MSKVEKKMCKGLLHMWCVTFLMVSFFRFQNMQALRRIPRFWLSLSIGFLMLSKDLDSSISLWFLIFLPAMNCWCLPERNSSCPHCMLKHCIIIGLKREHMFQLLSCPLWNCDFIGSLCHRSMKCNQVCRRKWSMISCIKEKIFNAQGDIYLSDETSHASCSCQIACRWLALNGVWLCAPSKIIFYDATGDTSP